MIRISGTVIPESKRLVIALTYVYGIGASSGMEIVKKLGFESSVRAKNLTSDDVIKVQNLIDSDYVVAGKRASQVHENIKKLKKIRCYRGVRLSMGLPVRGQRTGNKSGRRISNRGAPRLLDIKKSAPKAFVTKKIFKKGGAK